MTIETIAAALIRANRFRIDNEHFEDFDLSSPAGIEELAARAVAIHRALKRQELYHEQGSILTEPTSD